MTPNAEWWSKAHEARGVEKAPGADRLIRKLHTLWTLQYGRHICKADLWEIHDGASDVPAICAWELRYTIDGELRETRLYRARLRKASWRL